MLAVYIHMAEIDKLFAMALSQLVHSGCMPQLGMMILKNVPCYQHFSEFFPTSNFSYAIDCLISYE